MKGEELSRETLFALVWERPATELASEFGISDVALGKLCRRLQVPKPPRGYWAKVESGKIPRRPALKAFRAAVEKTGAKSRRGGQGSGGQATVQVSKLQREFLDRALQELSSAGTETSGCDLRYNEIRSIDADLAAQIVILIQNRFARWLAEKSTNLNVHEGSFRSLRGLVAKLLPLAKEQIVIFRREVRPGHSSDPDRAVIVRLSAGAQQRIGKLYRLARDNMLSYVAADLATIEHAWSVRYLHSPDSYSRTRSELCVSADSLWIRCSAKMPWGSDQFETKSVPIREVVPVELLPETAIELPAVIHRSLLSPYAKRLRALQDVETAYDIISSAVYRIDSAVPDEHLALVDRLWFGSGVQGPFANARRALGEVEDEIERWEQKLESERARLVCDVLGVGAGDVVLFEHKGKTVRMRLEGTSVYVTDKAVNFHLCGTRYRKDGLPGKRGESFVLSTENDLEP